MRFIYTKVVQQAIPVLALIVSGSSLAQGVSIPDKNTTYPTDINPKPAVVSQCMGCHGAQGMSQFPDWPNLAGLSNDYIKGELQKFKDGQRKNAMMEVIVKGMTEQEMNQVAAYFSGQNVAISVPKDLVRPKGLETCIACHGDGISHVSDLGPNIAGQQENYLLKQIQDFQSGKRKNEVMQNILKGLSPETIQQAAQYYSHMNIHVNSETGAQ